MSSSTKRSLSRKNFEDRHKVFISYHHNRDQRYKDKFLKLFGEHGADIFVDESVDTGDIDDNLSTETIRQKIRDEYISDATVIIVLIGKKTWRRKHVDWEISSGIRKTKKNSRCGLLGIYLPTHPDYKKRHRNPYTIPPRLYDNLEDEPKYADLYDWSKNPSTVSKWIHIAFEKRHRINPVNRRIMFKRNRRGKRWHN